MTRSDTFTNAQTARSATAFMTDMACAVEAARFSDKQLPPRIKAGSVERLLEEIERVAQMARKDPDGEKHTAKGLTFMGVPVFESKILPANIVVILEGDEVVNIIDLDKVREG